MMYTFPSQLRHTETVSQPSPSKSPAEVPHVPASPKEWRVVALPCVFEFRRYTYPSERR